MPGKKPKRDPSRWVKGSTFRLATEVLAEMDYIAEQLTRQTGLPHSRTDVIRVLVRREGDRLRRKEGG
jgi:hypothetical protein